jgi:hypothetical protein
MLLGEFFFSSAVFDLAVFILFGVAKNNEI